MNLLLNSEQISLLNRRDKLCEMLRKNPDRKRKYPPCCMGMAVLGYCDCKKDQDKWYLEIIRIEKQLGLGIGQL